MAASNKFIPAAQSDPTPDFKGCLVNNRKLEVATMHQAQLPVKHKDKLRMEVPRLTAQRSGLKDAFKMPSKLPVLSNVQEVMDITP